MAQADSTKRRYTPAEYFALEEQSEVRHEYYAGEIFALDEEFTAMAGGTIAHNLIKGNLMAGLRPGARARRCRLVDENVRLVVQDGFHFAYPDIMISCEAADRLETRQMRHPLLLIEVLSPSTSEYDRGRKFNQYKRLASLRHYLLVSQTAWVLEWFRRNEANEWVYTVFNDPADILEIPELDLRLTLAAVYDDTDVAPMLVVPAAG